MTGLRRSTAVITSREGGDSNAVRKSTEQWYGWIMPIFTSVFARQFYVGTEVLEDLADAQGA